MSWATAWRIARRDLNARFKGLRLLLVCLFLGTGALAAIGSLTAAIEGAGEEGYTLTTVNGAELTAMLEGGNVVLRDATGNTATVTQTDIDASNGVIHVIDTVLMPE